LSTFNKEFYDDDDDVVRPSVRSPVRLSVRRYCTKTAKLSITQTTTYDSPGTLVF